MIIIMMIIFLLIYIPLGRLVNYENFGGLLFELYIYIYSIRYIYMIKERSFVTESRNVGFDLITN